jgi:hypothetical protein
MLLLLAGTALAADPCLDCHALPGFAAGSRPLTVSRELYGDSVHGRLACTDCHKEIAGYPHGEGKRVRCDLPCHVAGASHDARAREVAGSVHGRLADPPCLACHDGGGAPREGAVERCRACHAGLDRSASIYPETPGSLADRAHEGVRPAERAPDCMDCHGAHGAAAAASARSSCAKEGCHPNAAPTFGELYDHGGKDPRRPWGGAGGWLLVAGAVMALVLVAHGLRE